MNSFPATAFNCNLLYKTFVHRMFSDSILPMTLKNPFTAVYLASIFLSALQAIHVIYLVALLDSVKLGLDLQIFALHPVLSVCGFLLYTTPNMVQTGYNPRIFPIEQSDINKQLALSSIWSFFAWLQIASQSSNLLKSAAFITSAFFALNVGFQMLMFLLSRRGLQEPIPVSPEPLLFSFKDSSPLSPRRHKKIVEDALLLIACIATGSLVLCICYHLLQSDISIIGIVCSAIGFLISSLHLYSYRFSQTSGLQLIEASLTFLLQSYQINFLRKLLSDDQGLFIRCFVYAALSVIFLLLAALKTFEKKNVTTKLFYKLTQSCSSKFTIGIEGDEVLLDEIPMPPNDA